MKEALAQLAKETQCKMEWLQQAGSTNDLATDPRYKEGDIILAEEQLSGRGQRGNTWNSTPGENLTFTLVLTPDFLSVEEQFYLSKVVALAVADTLEEWGLQASIKWPNDIYIGNRKIAGILIENDLMGSYLSRSLIGIGLNVNQTGFDPSLPNPTSVAHELGKQVDRTLLFRTLYQHLMARYSSLCDTASLAPIDRTYLARLFRLNEEHRFLDAASHEPFWGTICEVAPTGELHIRHRTDGSVHSYLFKEVEYVL